VDPDEVLLALHAVARPVIGSVEVFEPEQRVRLDDVLDLLEHLVLEFLALEHRLDDEVDSLEVGGVGRSA
jgi:hypothetical protein